MAENDILTQLIIKRGTYMSQLTIFEKHLSKISDTISEVEIKNLLQRVTKIEPLYDQFNAVQTEIEMQMVMSDNVAQSNQMEERELFQDSFFELTSKARTIVDLFNENLHPQAVSSPVLIGNSSTSNSQRKAQIKLPTITLPSFDGTFTLWREFFDAFSSLIHQNDDLSNVQKLTYLRASLKGEPADLLRSFETIDKNYEIAWSLLQKRYNNKRRIINNHVQAILNISAITRESNISLRQLINALQNHIQCLKSLGQPVEQWSALLIPIIQSKLDFQTVKDWEAQLSQTEANNDNLPTFNEFLHFLSNKLNMLETISNRRSLDCNKPTNLRTTRVFATTNQIICSYCKKNHFIYNCETFLKLNVSERGTRAKELRLCVNCLRKGHFGKDCQSKLSCRHCGGRHHSTLHIFMPSNQHQDKHSESHGHQRSVDAASTSTSERPLASDNSVESVVANCATAISDSQVLLSTARVEILQSNNKIHEVRALLDSASQSNFITEDVCNVLNLQLETINMNVTSINQGKVKITKRVKITLKSKVNNFTFALSCLVVPKISGSLPAISFPAKQLQIPSNIKLADPAFHQSQKIDILIGASMFYTLLCVGQINKPSTPTLQKTKLGWVISGQLKCNNYCNQSVSHLTLDDLHKDVERFWQMDEFVSKDHNLTDEEQYCEEYFVKTVTRDLDGKFIVKIPFKDNLNQLGNSMSVAESRFSSLENRFKKNNILKGMYSDFMKEYSLLNHMTKTSINEISFFLPHHAIIREHSETTKLRVVFDGSCHLDDGLPINKTQHVGPTLQNDLFSIIARFRTHAYVLTGDIEKMYRCVWIHPEHRKYQGILWRDESNQRLDYYLLNTVTYGTTSAPFLAVRCLLELAHIHKNTHPTESRIIKEDFYVDDLITGASSIQELKVIKANVDFILKTAGFNLRKWTSNILDRELCEDNPVSISKNVQKTLGIHWDPRSDTFLYEICSVLSEQRITKRTVLAAVSQLFDPLGLLGPVTILGKMLIQEIWQESVGWDEALSMYIQTKWLNFKDALKYVKQIRIPRFLLIQDWISIELHTFSDASEKAYGTCMYLRSENGKGDIVVQLLAAKSRVAPIKKITLPRLELCAAVLAAQIATRFKHILNIKFNDEYYWCDSQIVLSWINAPSSKWKTYVANRISEIQNMTSTTCWHYIQSADNAADLISRGLTANKLKDSNIWWHGPQWLTFPKSQWPDFQFSTQSHPPELRTESKSFILTDELPVFSIKNYSSIKKAKRIIAWCLRFITNCSRTSENRTLGPLTPMELETSMLILVKLVQGVCFRQELHDLTNHNQLNKKSNLLSLAPFLDSSGIIRVGGRLQFSKFSYNKRHPILLPKKNHFTDLVFQETHIKLLHAGPKLLLSTVRETFWSPCGKNTARQCVRRCVTCCRQNAKPLKPLMGSLPSPRVSPAPPFNSTGIDYAGPFLMKDRLGRGSKTTKCYICLFICFSVKAVHLEVVTSLTTDAFIAVFKRFIARRGKPLHIYSDNAKTFIGANNELKQLDTFLKSKSHDIQDFLSTEGITWHFIPPNSPHFGGLWEAGIKSTKHHLKRVLNNIKLTFEEYSTVITQIESILNSRPLTPLSSDPNDVEVLTPAHFLIGRSFTTIPDLDVTHIADNRLTRYQHLQKMIHHFWNKWSVEYIHELQQRQKWNKNDATQVKIGTLVLIKDNNLPPASWAIGRITALHPGQDGIIRVVTVQCSKGELKRAVSRVCVLPIDKPDVDL